MDGEDQAAQPGPWNPHTVEQGPEQQAADQVQHDGGDVVAGGLVVKERPLCPERRVGERKEVGAIGVEPELGETLERARLHDWVGRDQLVIVPEPVAVVGRRIDPQACEYDDRGVEQEVTPATGFRGRRDGVADRNRCGGWACHAVSMLFFPALASRLWSP
jgi:hypothetical protein